MSDLLPVTIDDMIEEVRRELKLRQRLYPQWQRDAGRNKRNMMDRQYHVMNAVLLHLEAQRGGTADERGTMDRG